MGITRHVIAAEHSVPDRSEPVCPAILRAAQTWANSLSGTGGRHRCDLRCIHQSDLGIWDDCSPLVLVRTAAARPASSWPCRGSGRHTALDGRLLASLCRPALAPGAQCRLDLVHPMSDPDHATNTKSCRQRRRPIDLAPLAPDLCRSPRTHPTGPAAFGRTSRRGFNLLPE